MEKLLSLYIKTNGAHPSCVRQLAGAGSNRVYYRMYDAHGDSVIGVVGTSAEENHAFIAIARHFADKQLPVPRVLAVSDDEMCYLQSDLGHRSLYDALSKGRQAGGAYDADEEALLVKTIRQLPRLQVCGADDMDWSVCYPLSSFDRDSIMFDLNYFKYCFLKATGIDFHEMHLEHDFRLMVDDLLGEDAGQKKSSVLECVGESAEEHTVAANGFFMYRDFQARNVMLTDDGAPCFIDFQGGRRGPFYYDVASFLWQASAHYPQALRDRLTDEYFDELSRYVNVPDKSVFRNNLMLFVLFRLMQVLGAYGFRGYFEHKQYFIDSIPSALANLREVLENNTFRYTYLTDLLKRLVSQNLSQTDSPDTTAPLDKNRVKGPSAKSVHGEATVSKYDGKGPLVVRVFSFSYKKGIPEDESGNGGGYVFDCRSTHNPGRYEPYKKLTGLDSEVIKFLEDDGEILTFLKSVYDLADRHVERYISRGFTSLMFSFGCTGGQHRSVYSAQHLAEHIHEKYGIKVIICHREQNIQCTLQ